MLLFAIASRFLTSITAQKVNPRNLFSALLPDFPFPALMAHAYIALVPAKHDLPSAGDNSSLPVQPGIYCRLPSAFADRFDLRNGIRQLHQSHGSGKKAGQEIGPQPKTQDRQIFFIYQLTKFINLR